MKSALIIALRMTVCGIASFLPAQTAKPPQPQGTVHIYRDRLQVGALTRTVVSCDNFPVARFENGRVFTMKMSVGRHAMGTNNNPVGFHLDVDADKEYFVRIDFATNASYAADAKLVQVPSDQGRMETMKLKPLDGRFIETGACGK
jgi:hypothetical protein